MTRPSRHVALLRAVNVGGGGKLGMADLRTAATDAGLAEVQTILQSGNLVFSSAADPAALEARLEALLLSTFALASPVMVRTASEWQRLLSENPFEAMADTDPAHLLLLAFKTPARRAEAPLVTGPEQIHVEEREAYVTYPHGIGRSKLTLARIERHFATAATGRNWSTVLKIAAALGL